MSYPYRGPIAERGPRRRVPRVFIGSSVEGLAIAQVIQVGLELSCEPTVWTDSVFRLSHATLHNLIRVSQSSEFAVLVLTPDDLVSRRQHRVPSPRDNVIFELGLFVGALGPERTFLVHPRDRRLALPSDLAGITTARFSRRADGNVHAALGPTCTLLRASIARIHGTPATARIVPGGVTAGRQRTNTGPRGG